ncbi:unnamed protein product [Oppiella nova]|uniref:MgtC/SapB/SrpB/YhiD N-terminal domain-containing protein n=1 Tax=Oppiella nova TaxID=334625 RepID=A0A7R9L931_9ACAR|nr:unnamed protein product [Oppiella nova]CAG2160309.1 unnamed protein product [Oppiella nova]
MLPMIVTSTLAKGAKLDEVPFDFVRRRMSVVVRTLQGNARIITKGAAEEMLKTILRRFKKKYANLILKVYVLLLSRIEILVGDQMTFLSQMKVFAKLSPVHKERIVMQLKENGHVVGFLGDGINDAAAIRSADIGISVDTAVDIAKDRAAMPLIVMTLVIVAAGGLIGFERQYRQRTAGADGSVRVIAYVVSGIGFLGAGVIMRQEGNIQGLNTAATLWCSAAVGAAAGCDRLVEAILATIFILAANTLLRPIGHIIDQHSKYVMDELNKALKRYHFPAKDFDVEPFGEQDVEIKAILIANSVEEKEIQPIIEMLNQMPEVSQAFWDQNTLA